MRRPGFALRGFVQWLQTPRGIVVGVCSVITCVALFIAGFSTYQRFSRMVDARLRQGPLGNSIRVYAAPHTLAAGELITSERIEAELRQAGYSQSAANPAGQYRLVPNQIEIYPGPESFFRAEPARVLFAAGRISHITLIATAAEAERYSLEPQVLFDLNEEQRQRRRFVHFDEIPKCLANAVLSAEDKHFFHHVGLDPIRIVKAAYVNLRSGRRGQGGSTLTMQLARSLWLDSRKNWNRKVMEALITLVLELKLSKKEIFEYYANEIYLGEHESFSIHGFGEAARIYLNKDVAQVSLSEAALLAGMVQRPNFFDPVKHPERVLVRRNAVLALMRQNGFITAGEEQDAVSAPSGLSAVSPERGDAPYFLTLAVGEFRRRTESSPNRVDSYRIYTTLEPGLQRAAVDAVRAGAERIDALLRKKNHGTASQPVPQVALIALDAHTGEVKAAVGGRNYGVSQLNHLMSRRQPGSVFKPFVYAAALSQIAEDGYLFTPSSMLDDVPTTFQFRNTIYEPDNFSHRFYGRVSLRMALAKSMNVATVSLAEQVGYEHVVELAKQAGLNGLHATPSVALGSYEVTPLEVAGAYTVFANEGTRVTPQFISEVRSPAGELLFRGEPLQRTVLDPKVAFLMRSLLEGVVESGTAAGVRSWGLQGRVAGKTGTSHDGWFAGFTSNLICVVWVGFDDNRELDLEGAKSALPIWAEFMKRAVENPYYGARFERPPDGIVTEAIDPETGELAGTQCPLTRMEYFIAGSEPQNICSLHGGGNPIDTTPALHERRQ